MADDTSNTAGVGDSAPEALPAGYVQDMGGEVPAPEPQVEDKSEGVKEPAPEVAAVAPPTTEEHLIALMRSVVDALEHTASANPVGNYVRMMVAQMRARLDKLDG